MYGWLWRQIPGGLAGKVAGMAALGLAVLAVLFFFLFPWIEPRLPWNEVTVDTPSISQTQQPSPASPTP